MIQVLLAVYIMQRWRKNLKFLLDAVCHREHDTQAQNLGLSFLLGH